jgi:hypothetical protein
MFDGIYSFEGSWRSQSLTASEQGKVITVGLVSPIVPAVFLIIWAVGTFVLALVYGFRARRAESLDGFDLFRLGAIYAPELNESPELVTADKAHEVHKLWFMPTPLAKG